MGSSTFGLVSLEKFLIPRIRPSRVGLPPGNSGSSEDPSILKILVISPWDIDPSGIPLSQPSEFVVLPCDPSFSSVGVPDLSSWKWMCRSDLLSAKYSTVVRLLSPSIPPAAGMVLSVLITNSRSPGIISETPLGLTSRLM